MASGSIVGGESLALTVEVDAQYSEGANRLWLEVENSDGVGHDSAFISVDNPPSAVNFTEEHVGFGDSEIVLNFEGIEDEDLADYQVFYASEEFGSESLPDTLVEVSGEPGEWVSVSRRRSTDSSVEIWHQFCAQATKKTWSFVRPSATGAAWSLALSHAL